ncbi:LOG family protein [Acidimangrovimonas pyrenivorans]|uniref:Cytokinin riboside 5'-monophosphate phosphoribohydrolase n=1 Tax=Acidimangrovimonas pyrenivorans TaxID=2030798 RepID=A0ABV7AMW5_9RHOB
MTDDHRISRFPDAGEDIRRARVVPDTPQARSPSYRLAYADTDFMLRDEMRPVRLQLELQKAELELSQRGIESTVILFGSARIPATEDAGSVRTPGLADLARYYDEARRFAMLVTQRSLEHACCEFVIATGGGPGIMEAGNRGAHEAGGLSVGLNIVLPHEQVPNRYVTPELTFSFHYFAIRKMHFLMRARAVAVFPGGFGTLDELFESITLIQTRRMQRVPLILFGRQFWERIVDWQGLVEVGTISADELELITFVETADEALAVMDAWNDGRGC